MKLTQLMWLIWDQNKDTYGINLLKFSKAGWLVGNAFHFWCTSLDQNHLGEAFIFTSSASCPLAPQFLKIKNNQEVMQPNIAKILRLLTENKLN